MLLEKFKRDLKVQNRSKKTMESIDQILGYAEKKLKKPIENLSIDELKNYFLKEQARGLNQNTVALTQAKFIQFYEWAFNETDEDKFSILARKLRKNKISRVKNDLNPSEILFPEDIKKLINVCTLERDRCIIAVLYESGMRIGELLALTTDMIEMDEVKQEVRLNIPNIEGCKTGSRSVICLEIYGFVQDWLKCNHSKKFVPLSRNGLRLAVENQFKKAGITKPCNIHHFRHSAITHAAGLNMNETQLSYRFWGIPHSTMLSFYIHLNEQLKSSGYRNAKGMGENSNGKTVINPLASRCVECGRLIQAGSLCKTCTDSKKLTEENVKLWKNIEELRTRNAMIDHENTQADSARNDYDNQIDDLKTQMESTQKFMKELIAVMPPNVVNKLEKKLKT